MTDRPFDRVIHNFLEKPRSPDRNQAWSQMDRTIRFFAKQLFQDVNGNSVSGFLKGGFNVVEDSPPAMTIIVKAGLGFINDPADVPTDIGGVLNLDDLESYKPVLLLADHTFSVPVAPTAPDSRIDIIEVKVDRRTEDNRSVEILDPAGGVFNPTLKDKLLAFVADGRTGVVSAPSNSTDGLSYKVGVAGNPGTVPATSPGYVKVAEIFVDNGTTAITDAETTDSRVKLEAANPAAADSRIEIYDGQWGQADIPASPGTDLWEKVETASGTIAFANPAVSGVVFATGAQNDGARLQTTNEMILLGQFSDATFDFLFQAPSLGVGTGLDTHAGIANIPANIRTTTEAAIFRWDDSAATFEAVTRSATVETVTALVNPVGITRFGIRLVGISLGQERVEFFIDGSLVAVHTTDVPLSLDTGSGTGYFPTIDLFNTDVGAGEGLVCRGLSWRFNRVAL